jgi:hypothetical protein
MSSGDAIIFGKEVLFETKVTIVTTEPGNSAAINGMYR